MQEVGDFRAWFYAARRGNLNRLRQLVSGIGVPIDQQEHESGNTVLMLAAFNGHSECVRWLVDDEQADLHARDTSGETALLKAARQGNFIILEFLLDRGAHIDVVGKYHHTPLMNAACNGHENCVQLLVSKRAMMDVVDTLGSTALMKAAYANQVNCVRSLLEAGALVNITDNNGQTALMKAALKRNPEIIELLLNVGAHVANKDHANSTALILVISGWRSRFIPSQEDLDKDIQCIKLLCEHGADVNCVDHRNETPLSRAAAIGFLECVRYLVDEKRAKKDIFNNTGQTALMIAAKNGCDDILQFLCERDEENVKDVADMEGYTAIMHAAHNNKPACVERLVHWGVQLDVVNHKRKTPLMYMAKGNFHSAVKALLEAGADPGRVDHKGRTAEQRTTDDTCRQLLEDATAILENQ